MQSTNIGEHQFDFVILKHNYGLLRITERQLLLWDDSQTIIAAFLTPSDIDFLIYNLKLLKENIERE